MPLTEEWWNPYRLLPVESNKERVKGKTLEKFSDKTFTGTIEAELTNKTLFFVGENELNKSLFIADKSDRLPFIPGTSLKGMIRSLAEYIVKDPPVVGHGSLKADSGSAIPTTFNMFGFLGKEVLRGKVSFSDARTDEKVKTVKKNYLPGSPKYMFGKNKETHTAFYNSPNLKKLYFHMVNTNPGLKPIDPNSKGNNIEPLEPGVTFKFNVYFENLSEKELNLLLYCLALEDNVPEKTIGNGKGSFKVKGDMCHKLGRAKSYGLGTVKTKINSINMLPETPSNRYQSYKDSKTKIYQGEELNAFIKKRTESYINDKTEHMENLRKMMIFDPDNKTYFKYPDYNWFKNGETDGKKNSQIPLKKI